MLSDSTIAHHCSCFQRRPQYEIHLADLPIAVTAVRNKSHIKRLLVLPLKFFTSETALPQLLDGPEGPLLEVRGMLLLLLLLLLVVPALPSFLQRLTDLAVGRQT